jgi:crotonobetainyl-CoA:carnitine CoA-transferase CaiB-like acyl-CoA transferase
VQSLEHLRVIDMSQVMAGPFCAMLLADHGADVIKAEPPRGRQRDARISRRDAAVG